MSAQNRALRVQEANFRALTAYAAKLHHALQHDPELAPVIGLTPSLVWHEARCTCRAPSQKPAAWLFAKLLRRLHVDDESLDQLARVADVLKCGVQRADHQWAEDISRKFDDLILAAMQGASSGTVGDA